jgi:hypothetical protein
MLPQGSRPGGRLQPAVLIERSHTAVVTACTSPHPCVATYPADRAAWKPAARFPSPARVACAPAWRACAAPPCEPGPHDRYDSAIDSAPLLLERHLQALCFQHGAVVRQASIGEGRVGPAGAASVRAGPGREGRPRDGRALPADAAVCWKARQKVPVVTRAARGPAPSGELEPLSSAPTLRSQPRRRKDGLAVGHSLRSPSSVRPVANCFGLSPVRPPVLSYQPAQRIVRRSEAGSEP